MRDWIDGITVRGKCRRDLPMANYCSWRVGGAAERGFEPVDREDLVRFLRALPSDESLTWIGLGSNVLVREGGLPGTVIFTRGLTTVTTDAENGLTVEAGVPCAKVARAAQRKGYRGGEFLAGIPGTVGGALAMNAGAFGGEIWTFVESVETINRAGDVFRRSKRDYRIAYRSVRGQVNEWFLSCVLRFDLSQSDPTQSRIRQLLGQRNASQPTGVASCGSVFKNPPGDYAGRLIDAAGLKGLRHGGCYVSDKHANFIINDDHATATDIEDLIDAVRDAVHDKFGIQLEPEVRIIGRKTRAPTNHPALVR
ncbi:MAG: UDP-N-acetylmuramate dehydrogenase [Gammaproteobacteria bacterium]